MYLQKYETTTKKVRNNIATNSHTKPHPPTAARFKLQLIVFLKCSQLASINSLAPRYRLLNQANCRIIGPGPVYNRPIAEQTCTSTRGQFKYNPRSTSSDFLLIQKFIVDATAPRPTISFHRGQISTQQGSYISSSQ